MQTKDEQTLSDIFERVYFLEEEGTKTPKAYHKPIRLYMLKNLANRVFLDDNGHNRQDLLKIAALAILMLKDLKP